MSLHEEVGRIASAAPDRTAVRSGGRSTGYAELDRLAGALAAELAGAGLRPGGVVAVRSRSRSDYVTAMLAVWRAGGAYLPLDPEAPAGRTEDMLDDAGATLLVEDGAVRETGVADRGATAGLAYLIYTSGTTGRPKGVAVGHTALAAHVPAVAERFGITGQDVVLQMAGPSVDVAVEQVLTALAAGACLVLPERPLLSVDELLRLIEDERVTVANLPAGYFHDFAAAVDRVPPSLRLMVSGSDRLSPAAAAEWTRRTGVRLLNAYGPTETVITATVHETAGETGSVPIGTPVGGRRAHVLDGLRPSVEGELYLGGPELAVGYLGSAAQTAARFLPDPSGPPGSRMYRTGDTVRRRPDGVLDFVGRGDDQVKVRGYRVELGEVQHALAAHPSVETCAVVPHGTGLAAYVTGAVDTAEVRDFLARRLPSHMVPASVTTLDRLPLTDGGKVDRAALPSPASAPAPAAGDDAPRDHTEQLLAGIWADVLGVRQVGPHDNFFHLGGDSLTAVRVASRVFEAFGPVSPYLVFEAPTLAGFAAALRAGSAPARPGPVARSGAPTPLSRFQRGLWLRECWEPGGSIYNVPWLFQFSGPLDTAALRRALQAVADRHDALRSTVGTDGDMAPVLVVHDHVEVPFTETHGELEEQVAAVAQLPFDLAEGPLLRARLVHTGPGEATLVLVVHHIVWDEGSLRVLDRELREYYLAAVEGRVPRLPELAFQYSDYTRWSTEDSSESDVDYWAEHLRGAPSTPAIRPDRDGTAGTGRGGVLPFAFDQELAEGVRALARAAGATPYLVLLAALVEAHRRRGVGDVVIGTPVSVRDRAELDALVGYFINLVPLRFRPDGEELTGRDLLDHVRSVALDGFRHQGVPFEEIVAATSGERSGAGTPLFQLVFEMHTADAGTAPYGAVAVEKRLHANEFSRFDLSWSVEDDGAGFHGRVEYAADLFEAATAAALSAQWRAVVEELVADLDAELPAVAEPADIDTPVHVRIAEQAGRTPGATALVSGSESLTYAELDAATNRVARHLAALGVVPGDVVAVRIPRDTALVVALLAVLKAGAAYTLLDPDLPAARQDQVVTDAGVRLVVTAETVSGASGEGGDFVVPVEADAVACVMYTSGSTGRPKGVAATHRALAATYSGQDYAGFGKDEVWLQCSPVSWDAFGLELYGALLFGGTCVLHPGQRPDPQTMAELVARHGVTQLQLSSSLFNFLVDELPEVFAGLRVAFTGGERASAAHIARLGERYPHVRVVNGYGPVESMGFTTTHDVTVTDLTAAVPIGKAVAHKGVHVLDDRFQPVGGSEQGEIYVTGAGLALGYVAQSGITAGRFLPDPFGPPGSRMYRTGDIGGWNADGTLAITGRADDQVKIRGFRVEPGEVATALAGCPGVGDCAVVAHEPVPGRPRLAAYVTARGDVVPDLAGVHDFLAGLLPDYMLPSSVTVLDALPITANGKLDRAALPGPSETVAVSSGGPNTTDAERLVARVWAEVLGLAEVGPQDNFFRVGGNSLAAVRVAMHLSSATGSRVLPRQVFAARTVSALARTLETTGAAQ
ncbi:non-ribosomal peptide synthetase [Lentzea albidocapillata]|uniref:Amino acid adenylation domain-containing protein n=1 Tax=Lentzea albidocapillata TaxID=40571 RepID=A0A1W1ZKA0_9PSEU|nr:non-ribosomal peptide synthetase [Lentzea albidocapillata]SMC48814.1 amino acid adenylation domain-containing protein [Lentzea albidocapillata]